MKNFKLILTTLAISLVMSAVAKADWSIDLSRRTGQMRKTDMSRDSYGRSPAAVRTYEGEEPPFEDSKRSWTPSPETSIGSALKPSPNDPGFVDKLFNPDEPAQDIVILNTERGFVPNTIRIRKDGRYTVHVVNVNEKEKNVSFILDGFSEHHGTFFGKVKTFRLEPKKEGVYSFLSPETAIEGKFIVFTPGPAAPPPVRLPSTAQVGE